MKPTIQEQVQDLGRLQNELPIQNGKLYAHCFELENQNAQLIESNREIERTKDIEIATLKDQLSKAQLELERQKVQMLTAEADRRKMDLAEFDHQRVQLHEQILALQQEMKQLKQTLKIAEDEKVPQIPMQDNPMKQSDSTFGVQELKKEMDKLRQRMQHFEDEKLAQKQLPKQVLQQQSPPKFKLFMNRKRAQSQPQHELKLNSYMKQYYQEHQQEEKQQQFEQQEQE